MKIREQGENPELDKFSKLSLEEMEAELAKNPSETEPAKKDESHSEEKEEKETSSEKEQEAEVESKETEKSETEEEEKESDKEKPSEEVDKDENDEEETVDSLKAKNEKLEKNYKELQADYTRRNQKAKEKDAELESLKTRLEKLEKGVKPEPEKKETKSSVIEAIRKENPDAAKIFEDLKAEIEAEFEAKYQAKLKEEIEPLKQDTEAKRVEENIQAFQSDVATFMKGDLKDLEPEMNKYLEDNWDEVQELMLKGKDAFAEVKRRVVDANLDKVAKILSSKSPKKEKQKELDNNPVGGKSKSTKTDKSKSDISSFRKLSLEEMEQQLPRE